MHCRLTLALGPPKLGRGRCRALRIAHLAELRSAFVCTWSGHGRFVGQTLLGDVGLEGAEKSIDRGGADYFGRRSLKTDRKLENSLARVIYVVYSATGRTFQNAKLKLKLFERDIPHGIIIMGRVLFRSTGSGTGALSSTGSGTGALNEHRFSDSRGKIKRHTGVL